MQRNLAQYSTISSYFMDVLRITEHKRKGTKEDSDDVMSIRALLRCEVNDMLV